MPVPPCGDFVVTARYSTLDCSDLTTDIFCAVDGFDACGRDEEVLRHTVSDDIEGPVGKTVFLDSWRRNNSAGCVDSAYDPVSRAGVAGGKSDASDSIRSGDV